MSLSIRALLHNYAAAANRTFTHDRMNTVGASEIGKCIRQVSFAKIGAPIDRGYVDSYGARLRGVIIEDHYVVPGLRTTLPKGVELLYAGADQTTLVDGYLSATPDGLLVGVERDCLAWLGVPDIGSDCLVVEFKSIDPRVDLGVEKPEHSFQTQVQMGLLRAATQHQPNYALISYVDASFLDRIDEFAVKFDPAIYETAQRRAHLVMAETDPLHFLAEGKLAGGRECKYCPWASHCADISVAGMPPRERVELGENAEAELRGLRDAERVIAAQVEADSILHRQAQEEIKAFLKEVGTRHYNGDGWSVSWQSVKGRVSLDREAIADAGIDLEPFETPGRPGERLIVR